MDGVRLRVGHEGQLRFCPMPSVGAVVAFITLPFGCKGEQLARGDTKALIHAPASTAMCIRHVRTWAVGFLACARTKHLGVLPAGRRPRDNHVEGKPEKRIPGNAFLCLDYMPEVGELEGTEVPLPKTEGSSSFWPNA